MSHPANRFHAEPLGKLSRKDVVHDVREEEKSCGCCGQARVRIGEDSSEQLELEPARKDCPPFQVGKSSDSLHSQYAVRQWRPATTKVPLNPGCGCRSSMNQLVTSVGLSCTTSRRGWLGNTDTSKRFSGNDNPSPVAFR